MPSEPGGEQRGRQGGLNIRSLLEQYQGRNYDLHGSHVRQR